MLTNSIHMHQQYMFLNEVENNFQFNVENYHISCII